MVYKLVKVGMKFLVDKLLLTSFVAAVVKAIALSRYACNFKKMLKKWHGIVARGGFLNLKSTLFKNLAFKIFAYDF